MTGREGREIICSIYAIIVYAILCIVFMLFMLSLKISETDF